MTWTKHFHETGKVGTLTDSKNYHHYIGEITENGKTGTLLYIQHQTAPGLFEELRIQDLNGMSTIKKDGYASISANALGDATFTIPVSHFIINQLTKKEQLVLYEHILRIDAYAAELQHLEFYETEAFINFFNFAAIAITIFTLGTASGYVEIAKQLLYQYLVTQLVIKIAELTGSPELAALIGLAALAVGGTYSGDSALGFLEPEMLLLASTNFADNLTTVYNLDMQGIKTEIEQMEEMYEERLEAHEIKEDNPITAEFLVALNSIDNGTFPAIRAQYDFDVMFEYDVIIKDYYNNHYRTGID
jgi:hypothetical protein